MASRTKERRHALVEALRLRAGYAETTDPGIIMPIPEHLRAFEAEVVLIVGDRGSGKTQLKSALQDERIRMALMRNSPTVRVPFGGINWVQGWPLGTAGPDPGGWRALYHRETSRPEDSVGVWLAYLLRTVGNDLLESERVEAAAVFEARGVDAEAVLAGYRSSEVAVTAALDALDQRLRNSNQWLFIAYDELDTLVADDWDAMGFAVRGVVSFWAGYSRRWQRIRPKLFLRSDFYQHHRNVAGADVAKLAGNRVELQWSDKHLYAALIKHVINKQDSDGNFLLRDYFAKAVKGQREDPDLGIIPLLKSADEAKPFVSRLISEFMGANAGKGNSFRWILDHLRDGNGKALPRSLVMLIEHAATIEANQPRAVGAHLLHHTSIRNALDEVSKEYVTQAQTHEMRWLVGLANRLKKQPQVPWTKRDLIKLLKVDFGGVWSPHDSARPPGADADELLENLVNLGVIRRRAGDSFDVPDLYLHGLDLRRKGGVARK